ncbi:MAG: prepilin-type N-terminal cleavage/methylation domain-containing protein [Lachnospiraceae bacterium]|nr:prepilin-type N-terminal cleavage/methylation domain-containing protein [Lachnospiraceae bacterium]
MFNLKKKLKEKKGFTLAELLIVVAIIAVLVAISIPIFTSQLEKSREAVDAANIRATYAECQTAILTDGNIDKVTTKEITLKQQKNDWQTTNIDWPKNLTVSGEPTAKGKATFTYTAATATADGTLTVTFSAASPAA